MSKKGIHHVEYVIAISIFIVAVISIIFLMYSLPKSTDDNSLNIAEKNFEQMNEILVKESVLTIGDLDATCYNLEFNPNLPSKNLSVTSGGSPIDFKIEDSKIFLAANGEYTIYSGEEFTTNTDILTDCQPLSPGQYSYSIVNEENFISDNRLIGMNLTYYHDGYEYLKQVLNINKDFSIKITNGTIPLFDMSRSKPLNVEVHAKEFRIKIINKNAEVTDALVNLQIW
jgi:hypothetical protein